MYTGEVGVYEVRRRMGQVLKSVLFTDEGGEGQAPLSIGYLYANGVPDARMKRGVKDRFSSTRAEVYEGGVRPQGAVCGEVVQDGVHSSFTKLATEAAFTRAAGNAAGIVLCSFV